MIKNIIFAVIMFIVILSVPYIMNAGVVLDAKNKTITSESWTNPNYHEATGDYFVSKDGLLCANRIWQVPVNGLLVPARKCKLPNGSWATFYY
jgi:hypothetical protein|tara:strand:- start:457 stop:735 length:279 start_codon:yes stop_codon:yes gene_type:complete